MNESILDVSQPKVKEPSKEVLDNVNHNNSYIKKKAKTVNNKKLLKKNLKHIGNYLTPTFATVMKKTKKVRLPNVLEQVPFIAGQSSNRSHNLAARLQENKILDKINGSRTDTNLQINKIDSILSNQMHMINNIKRKWVYSFYLFIITYSMTFLIGNSNTFITISFLLSIIHLSYYRYVFILHSYGFIYLLNKNHIKRIITYKKVWL